MFYVLFVSIDISTFIIICPISFDNYCFLPFKLVSVCSRSILVQIRISYFEQIGDVMTQSPKNSNSGISISFCVC